MIKGYSKEEIEEIKNLIKDGFDLKSMSLEFDIPIVELEKLKSEIYKKPKENMSKATIKSKSSSSKMDVLREKYNKLYLGIKESDTENKHEPTQQEIELIDKKIEEFKIKLEKAKFNSKGIIVYEIKKELVKMKEYGLTIEQAEKMYELMQMEELKSWCRSNNNKFISLINDVRRTIVGLLSQSIEFSKSKTNNLEELKALSNRITNMMELDNPIATASVKSNINTKIQKIKQQNAIDRIRNDIPEKVLEIISDLANDTFDIQKAYKIIEEEAKKKVETKTKNKFSLTEEQEKRQILVQIKTAIKEKTEQYPIIKNPEGMIFQIKELCSCELEEALDIVIESLINRKDLKRASEICDKLFYSESSEGKRLKNISSIIKKIKSAKLGDMVQKGLNVTNGSVEEENKYFELIEKYITVNNIKPETVILGKSQDGTKTITLADIWPYEKVKGE